MKKIVICSIPMKKDVAQLVFASNDASLSVSDMPFRYPILSLLAKTTTAEDELKFILLVKKDGNKFYEKNVSDFLGEAAMLSNCTGVSTNHVVIDTDFSEDKETHCALMGALVDEIEEGTPILADITYGPKDIPVIIFSALTFAENFLGCEIENIVYGQAEFKDNKVVSSKICDMAPLYYLSSVSNSIKCDDPAKARQMLHTLISL